jgi:hypothetical protein
VLSLEGYFPSAFHKRNRVLEECKAIKVSGVELIPRELEFVVAVLEWKLPICPLKREFENRINLSKKHDEYEVQKQELKFVGMRVTRCLL